MKASKFLTIVVILMLALGLTFLVYAQATKTIWAGALENHGCDDTEWHFVITQVAEPSLAPASITVVWANGASENVPLEEVTGKTAHYRTTSNLDSTVVSASAEIYSEWSGQFNLSHGPCPPITPTPTVTPTETDVPTPTPTETEVPTATPTQTDIPTATPTETDVPTPTPTETDVPTVTPTNTDVPTATPTETEVPTITPTETDVPTATPTETDIPPETPTPTGTNIPTEPPKPTPTDNPLPTPFLSFIQIVYQIKWTFQFYIKLFIIYLKVRG